MSAIMKHDMKAILGEDFFKEEVRCDYKISETQKMMWAMQIDLYMVFAEICEKYGLKYFMMYGGLLGAIRHDGFIPWDDDLDVAMPREDYDKFIQIAPKELSEPYALQCPYTYPNCYITNITIRNSMGTFTPKRFAHLDYNKGIPMDIFPLDYCDPVTIDKDQELIYEHILRCSSWMNLRNPCLSVEEKEKHIKHKTNNPLHDWEMIQKIASNPKYKGSDYLVQTVVMVKRWYGTASPLLRAEWFNKTEPHLFESIQIIIPAGWDKILCKLYGDNYMQYPPIHERGNINNSLIVDPFTPYKEIKW
jgi:lipopolysaccharide cholinephosphotransferase